MEKILQKYIASSGYCSRRQAEKLIRESVFWEGPMDRMPVLVNGQKPEIGMMVSDDDEILIYGKTINLAKEKIYIILNKPVGVTCTNRDFRGEINVFDLLTDENNIGIPYRHRENINLHIVGRLDKNSRGLLILTNDGDLTQKITHPSFEHKKIYEVGIRSAGLGNPLITEEIIRKMKQGVDIGDGDGIVKAGDITLLKDSIFQIELTEGKKRQIRRMFKQLGEEVTDIKRIAIGNLELGDMPEGKWRRLEPEELELIGMAV